MSLPPDHLSAALAHRYRLKQELGQGGMAAVYLAEDLKHGRDVAIKVMRPELAAGSGAQRFLREIRTIAALQHPHILGLIDSGEVAGTAYFVMPFVEGESLRDLLDRDKQLSIPEAIRIATEIATALDYAHRHGVLHRDIKPENILLHDGQALIADFGIALEVATGGDTRLTETGMTVGTPRYMSPEQILGGQELTARTDIFSLGAVLYEMLLGEPPFGGATAQTIVARVLAERPAPPRSRRDTVPENVEAAVLKALEKLPADRFATAAEFAAALREPSSAGLAAGTRTRGRADRTITSGAFRLTGDVCRRIARSSFDPRLIGSEMAYLDNGVESDVLVCFIAACGRGGDQFSQVLRHVPYRGVAPTFRGFEPDADWRPAFPLDDHVVLLREFLRDQVARLEPRLVIVVGFSSGGDFAIRFAAAPDPGARLRLDGCVTLGANLSLTTCFLTNQLAELEKSDDDAMLAILRSVSERASTLDEWVNICEYVAKIVPVFRRNPAPLRVFAADISVPFEKEPLTPFAEWYRAAAERGCRLCCVFEDSGMYRPLVRDLLLKNLDEGLLGERYEELSVITEAGTNHFDLLDPARVTRHLASLVARLP